MVPNTEEEIVFTLGSLFYPKVMKRIYIKEGNMMKEIETIHNMLAKFSAKNMKVCFESNSFCRVLLRIFIES